MFYKKLDKAIKLYDLAGVHPAANLFPLMNTEELERLKKDAVENGWLYPVKVTKEKLLIDGRNRLIASIEIEKNIHIMECNPIDPIAYVLSENLYRRHLTVGQRAIVALNVDKMYALQAKKKMEDVLLKNAKIDTLKREQKKIENIENTENSSNIIPPNSAESVNYIENESREKAAKALNVGHTAVSIAKRINKEAPELLEKVKTGEITLNKAKNKLKEQLVIKESKPKFSETNDSIEWARYTWNPVTGCLHDCPYCYAKDIAIRFTGHFKPTFHSEQLSAPKNTKCKKGYPNNVFVCSMTDLFGDWVEKSWIDQVIKSVEENPQWNFLFLTKNPKRYMEFKFPKNCWLGATGDTQKRVNVALDIFSLLDSDNVQFLSCEPLLGNVSITMADKLDWVIIGSRSKNNKLPEYKWVKYLTHQCWNKNISVYWKPNLKIRIKEFPNDCG